MAMPPLPPLRVREADGAPNVIPVFEVIFSGATVTKQGPTTVQVMMDSGAGAAGAPTGAQYVTLAVHADLSAERTLAAGTGLVLVDGGANNPVTLAMTVPVVVSSGGTGAATFTAMGLLYGSGASAIQVLAPLSSGSLVVGSGVTTRAHILGSGAVGTMLVADGVSVGGMAWAATNAYVTPTYVTINAEAALSNERTLAAGTNLYLTDAGAGANVFLSNSARLVRLPMALMTVAPDSSNAFWTANSGTNVDTGYVAFVDGGVGWATYWTLVPLNLHPDPNWTVQVYNSPEAGAGGNVIFSLSGRTVVQTGTIDAAYTSLVSVGTMVARPTTVLGIGTTSPTNFDASLTLSGGDLLLVELTRHGQLAGDTVGQQWNVYSVALECNVL